MRHYSDRTFEVRGKTECTHPAGVTSTLAERRTLNAEPRDLVPACWQGHEKPFLSPCRSPLHLSSPLHSPPVTPCPPSPSLPPTPSPSQSSTTQQLSAEVASLRDAIEQLQATGTELKEERDSLADQSTFLRNVLVGGLVGRFAHRVTGAPTLAFKLLTHISTTLFWLLQATPLHEVLFFVQEEVT